MSNQAIHWIDNNSCDNLKWQYLTPLSQVACLAFSMNKSITSILHTFRVDLLINVWLSGAPQEALNYTGFFLSTK